VAIRTIDAHGLPLFGAVLILASLGLPELAHSRIVRHATAAAEQLGGFAPDQAPSNPSAGVPLKHDRVNVDDQVA